jgi:DNA repair protein RadA
MIDVKPAERIDTGSTALNSILGGGLSKFALTDVFGAAATGKTQFAFQSAVMVAAHPPNLEERKPLVVFIDCAGSFRPERIAEIAETRGFRSNAILDSISSIYVRSVAEQHEATERIFSNEVFDRCELVIVDDVTTNFTAEYSSFGEDIGNRDQNDENKKKVENEPEEVYITRHFQLATYARELAYLALSKNLSVLFTNSVRSGLGNSNAGSKNMERETTGEIISQFGLFRLHFTKQGNMRTAEVIQPYVLNKRTRFRIESRGIMP